MEPNKETLPNGLEDNSLNRAHEDQRRIDEIDRTIEDYEKQDNPTYTSDIETLNIEKEKIQQG